MHEKDKIRIIREIRNIINLPEEIDIEISSFKNDKANSQSGEDEGTYIRIKTHKTPIEFYLYKNISGITREDLNEIGKSISEKIKRSGFLPRHLSKFFGWWVIFSGSITLFAVCPFCGSAGCAGSFAFTGILGCFLAVIKNYYDIFKNTIRKSFAKVFK